MLMSDKDRKQLKTLFEKELREPVALHVYTQQKSVLPIPVLQKCEGCETCEQLAADLAQVSKLITVTIVDYTGSDDEIASKYTIDRIPCITVVGKKDPGILFYGTPTGYEFAALIEAIIDVSKNTTALSGMAREKLKILENHVNIKVFVTPTCPFCPKAVRTAHQMAVESDYIAAEMIQIQQFPHLAQKYNVTSVPKIVLNDSASFEGALPDYMFADHVLMAAGQLTEKE